MVLKVELTLGSSDRADRARPSSDIHNIGHLKPWDFEVGAFSYGIWQDTCAASGLEKMLF